MKYNIGYVRVSTSQQVQDGVSLEAQEAKIQAYASLNDIENIIIVRDEGISGSTLNRKGIEGIIELIQDGKVDNLIVYSLSRISRKCLDLLNLIDLFGKKNVAFHSLTEHLNTSSPTGRFLIQILGAVSELERGLISERVKGALAYKKENGEKTGGQIPYGFTCDDGKLIPKDDEMFLISKMMYLREEKKLSYLKICDRLSELGLTSRTGKKFHPQTVKQILSYHQNSYVHPV